MDDERIKNCDLFQHIRTIATHPASTTHSKLTDEERAKVGITPGMVRIAVGLESVEDIIGDVEQAL